MKDNLISLFTDVRSKMIDFLKDYGLCNIKTFRLFDDEFGVPSYESCIITKIENGFVYYSDNVRDEISILTISELYDIMLKLNN